MFTDEEKQKNKEYLDKYDNAIAKAIKYTDEDEKPYPGARYYIQVEDVKVDCVIASKIVEYFNKETLMDALHDKLQESGFSYLTMNIDTSDKDYEPIINDIKEMNESITAYNAVYNYVRKSAQEKATKYVENEHNKRYYEKCNHKLGDIFIRKFLEKNYPSVYSNLTTKQIDELITDFAKAENDKYSFIKNTVKAKYNLTDLDPNNLYIDADEDDEDYEQKEAEYVTKLNNIKLANEEIDEIENKVCYSSKEHFLKYYLENCSKYVDLLSNKKNVVFKNKNNFIIDGIKLSKKQVESLCNYVKEKE